MKTIVLFPVTALILLAGCSTIDSYSDQPDWGPIVHENGDGPLIGQGTARLMGATNDNYLWYYGNKYYYDSGYYRNGFYGNGFYGHHFYGDKYYQYDHWRRPFPY